MNGRTRRGVARVVAPLLAIFLLTACSGPPPPDQPLKELHLPYTTMVPGVAAVEARIDARIIFAITTYVPSSLTSGQPRILYVLGSGGGLNDIGMNGSTPHPIPGDCGEALSVSPDGRWLACQNDRGIALIDLTEPALGSQQIFTNAGSPPALGSAAWVAGGRYLAVESKLGGCSIALYAVSSSHQTYHLAMLLSFKQFVFHGPDFTGCAMLGLTASPDGAWLAFTASPDTTLYAFSLADILPQLSAWDATQNPPPKAKEIAIPSTALITLGLNNASSSFAWSSDSRAIAFVSQDGWSIEQCDLASRRVAPILTQRVAGIGSISWTPDGRHLVFVLGTPTGDFVPPAPRLYVYTPPRT